jgi:hypothetical protein
MTFSNTSSDSWATKRDDATRENLDLSKPPTSSVLGQDAPPPPEQNTPKLSEEIAELSEKSFRALEKLTQRDSPGKAMKWPFVGRALKRAGLIDKRGAVTKLGERVIRHLRDGRHLALLADGAPPRLLTFWINGPTALVVMSLGFPGAGSYGLGFCPTERIPELLLQLISFHPAWSMDFTFTLTRNELLAKQLAGIPPKAATSRDAAAFAEQYWVPVSLIGPTKETELAWVMAVHRGAAVLSAQDGSDEITLTSDPENPFWELLLTTTTRLIREENP